MSTAAIADRPSGPDLMNRRKSTRSRLERAAKRVLDLFGAIVALALSSPILIASAVLIKLEDGGPVFYRRRVVGQQGEFDAFKLRTMRTDADRMLQENPELRAEYEQAFKLKSDPRITKVGAVLRKYSLDELPQLFNVLMGQMS